MSELRPMNVRDRVLDATHTVHQKIRAVYDKTQEAAGQLGHVRTELDKLTNLGDMVTEDDVISAAGRLVGHGLGAERLAEMLGTMPTTGGQALAAWIQQQDAVVRQHEFVVEHTQVGLRHELGQSALRVLAAEHLAQPGAAPVQGGGETMNIEQGAPPSGEQLMQ